MALHKKLIGFKLVTVLGMMSLLGWAASSLSTPASMPQGKNYSPYANRNYPTRVYWGETHLHTSYSPDAGLVGDRLNPDDAYRFSRGEQIMSSSGQPVQLIHPLDWVAISDHSEYFGLPQAFEEKNPDILNTASGKKWSEALKKGGKAGYDAFVEMTKEFATAKPSIPLEALLKWYSEIWSRTISAAEKNNKPGLFSALVGFEWTQSINGNNLHRNVIFGDGSAQLKQVIPFSEFDSPDPLDLWKYMEDYEKKTSGHVLAIEHNPNLSGGLMFAPKTWEGKPFDAQYAALRTRFDRLVEITQSKGDSETTPQLSPDDPFANFERWNKANIFGMVATTPEMLPYNYVRSALKMGLDYHAKIGQNPFNFGFIGASDQHTSLPTTRAENYFGVGTIDEPKPDRWKEYFLKSPLSPKLDTFMWEMAPGGLTGVWARENTRESIWNGLYNREIYATSGTRITVRNFAGWNFKADDIKQSDPIWVKQGYEKGVPMGGNLSNPPKGSSPTLMIKASADPDGAYLDRIQVVKGWVDKQGASHEKVFDVAWSGNRVRDPKTGLVPSVGSTVDLKNATWTNTIGAAVLNGFWQDPVFNPDEYAFYYVRVIEIPTVRWTDYDVKRFGIKMADQIPMTVVNRAYTSPIWYSPSK